MANLINQADSINTPSARYQDFNSFYRDDALDPFQRSYERIMTRFDPEVNNVLTHVILMEHAVGSGPVPQAYLCCIQRQNQVKVVCVHIPSRYPGALDGQVTPWDGINFACLGEVVQGQITTVILPDNSFRAIWNVRAKSSDYIITHHNEMGVNGFPHIAADEEDATLTATRALMYLPARYVPLLLNPAGYSLRQLWEILYPAIVEADELITCAPLLKWMRIASMGTPVRNNAQAIGPTSIVTNLEIPFADADLINHRVKLYKAALPGLYQPSESLERAITQMAAAVTLNTNDNRIAREEKAAKSTTPKLPSDRFTVTIQILQGFLNTPDEKDLPPLWHKWANCNKRQEFNVLSENFQAYARGPDAFSANAPKASAKLVQDLLNFNFVSENTDDIKSGLQPFIIVDGSAEHRQANMEIAQIYGLLQAGDHSVMLSDLQALQAKEVLAVPLNYFDLERNLGMFGNLLGTVLGSTHILTVTYRDFWKLLFHSYRQELQQVIDIKRHIKPAHVLRSIQLICHNWFSQRKAQLTPLQPEFAIILYNIALSTYIIPNLPPALYRLAYPYQKPPLVGVSNSSQSSSNHTGSTGSNGSFVSAVTLPTLGSRTRGTHVLNLTPDASLTQLIPPGVKIKDLIGTDPPPSLDNGHQLCLSYLLRQGCWSNCRRANTHNHNLTPSEKARLVTYVTTQAHKLRPSGTATTSGGSVTPP